MDIAYYNGKVTVYQDMSFPITDRAVFFGDGIYDAAIGKDGEIYLEREHTERFIGTAKRLGIPLPLSEGELPLLLRDTVKKSGEECYMVYFHLTRSGRKREHAVATMDGSNLLITVTKIPFPDENECIRLVSYPDERYGYCNIKTLNLLPSVMAATYARSFGADEAVFIRDGVVTECAHSNISIIKGDTLYTHPKSNRILGGIMREKLIEACREIGVNVVERSFGKAEIFAADATLVTSSTKLCRQAFELDGEPLRCKTDGLGQKLTKMLHFSFSNF